MSFEENEERYFGEQRESEEEFDEGGYDDEIDGGEYNEEKDEGYEEADFEERVSAEGDEFDDYKATFADTQRTAGGAIGTGVSRIQKSKRSAQDAAQDKAKGMLNDETYSWVTPDDKLMVYNKMAKIDNIERYNIETLVPAILFVGQQRKLDKNFNSFYKKLFEVNKLDLIRYIRMLETLQ